jgi:hypothetical protein
MDCPPTTDITLQHSTAHAMQAGRKGRAVVSMVDTGERRAACSSRGRLCLVRARGMGSQKQCSVGAAASRRICKVEYSVNSEQDAIK